VVVAVAVALTLAGCSSSQPGPRDPAQEQVLPAVPGPDGRTLFEGAGNPWYQQVADDAPVDPRSADYVRRLLTEKPLVSVNGWTIPVYEANSTTRRYAVSATEDHTGGGWTLPGVPIPDSAAPDPEEDGHMVVVDRAADCVYELWQASRDGDGWTASWVNATPADGTGVYPDGLSARASGLSAAAGLIWPQELAAGEIKHALVFAYPYSAQGDPAAPATASDGRTGDGAALPMGSRLRLDPSVDVDSLGLPPAERTIAHALQTYGMILADTSGGFTLYAVAPQSFPSFPYPKSWSRDIWKDISAIPFDRMQVVSAGTATPRHDGAPITNRCSRDVQQTSGD
jgi:hypothetical protein